MALRGKGCAVGGACIAQPAGVRRRCVGEQKCLGGRVAVRGREEAFGGEWVVRSAGLTHIRRSSTRARVLLYIRPACPRREIAAMGSKDAPCEHPSPANDFRTRPVRVCTSAPAFTLPPSAFTLPPHRLPRPPRGAIGLPPQQLSTMGYPRKSYPHRCPPPCAKRARPRACARVYIIYRSPVGCSRGVSAPLRKRVRAVVAPCPAPPCAGWGRAKAKADASSCSAEHAACVPNHCVQRRKCTRPTPPLPVRSPRGNLSTAASPPVDGRSAERKGGSAQGNPRSCPCVLPATACLRPCLRPLMGEVPCVLPASARLRPRPRPLMGEVPCVLPAAACLPPRTLPADGRSAERRVGEGEGKGGRPLAQQPAPARAFSPATACLRPAPAA